METGNPCLCFKTKALLHFWHKKKLWLPFSFLSSHSSPPYPLCLSRKENLLPHSAPVGCCPFVLSSAQLWPEKADKFTPFSRMSNFQIWKRVIIRLPLRRKTWMVQSLLLNILFLPKLLRISLPILYLSFGRLYL